MIRSQARANSLPASIATVLVLMSAQAAAQPSVPVTQPAAGRYFTCALTAAGGAKCWGSNVYGQLGDTTTTDRAAPVDVSGLTAGVAAIAAGDTHACALTTAGGVKCWGANFYGEVGDGTGVQRFTPVDVTGLASGVAAIAAGGSHTCALTTGGGVKCWGQNTHGQVGDDSNVQRPAPVDVAGLASGVAAISTGAIHTCALTAAGGVKCWGYNLNGQLGDTSATHRKTPVDVSGLGSGVRAVAAGVIHTCALTVAGGVKCWGAGPDGQLGDGLTTDRAFPGDVSGLTAGMAAVAAGTYHACALTTGGAVKCWGANVEGQVGDGTNAQRLSPVDVPALTAGVVAITAGDQHTCALSAGGNMKCWGRNSSGQVGDTTLAARNSPTKVSGLSSTGIAMLAAGQSHTCALSLTGGLKCWGFNSKGQLGNNSTVQSLAPVDVLGLTSGVTYIASSKAHTCAVTAGGGAKCWGENVNGSLGDDTVIDRSVPTDVFGLTSGIAAVTMAPTHACSLSTAGFAHCWGGNIDGRVGDGTNDQRLRPSPVQQSDPFVSISAGYTHTCALAFGGVVQCWGNNVGGQLGDPGLIPPNRNVPGNVASMPDIAQMEAGADHTCALTTGGGLKCWGRNFEGQIGDGTLTQRPSPVDVAGLTSGIAVLSTGDYHTCALTTAGGAKCWGDNFYAQLGDATTNDRDSPVNVTGLATGVVDLDAAFTHTCALTTAGGVKCWGYNLNGQLGDNTTINRTTPVGARIGGQSISFTPPARLAPGVPTSLAAIASGGLAVTFDTWTPNACTVTGGSVTATGVGLCGLRASQAGDANLSPAPQALRLVPVAAPVRGDANGDFKADLFWREASPGTGLSWWTMDGAAAVSSNFLAVASEWQIAKAGDLDGDGKADLVWRRTTDGAAYLWLLDGLGFKGFFDLGALSPAAWSLAGARDLDADGKADLLWRNVDGTLYGWIMNGGTIASQGVIGNPGPEWAVIDVVDMNGDGKADIVFRNTNSGQVFMWFMNGLALASAASPGGLAVADWSLLAAADFDGDGKGDLLWRSTTGDTWVWIMDGATFVSGAFIGNPGLAWTVRTVADLDGDGKADLVWRHTDGTTYFWKMNGVTPVAFLPVTNPGGTWQVVAP